MQQTRLNTLFDASTTRLNRFFSNPWRRISLNLLGLFIGMFVGQAVSTTAGQRAYLDVTVAAVVLLFTETISRIAYSGRKQEGRSLWLNLLNMFKIGVSYSLYLEALKLGS